jgi:hypothetical protein
VAAQLRPELLEEPCQRQNLRPHIFVQFVEFRLKLIANLYAPAHSDNMPYSPYDVKSISPEPAPQNPIKLPARVETSIALRRHISN